MQDCTTWTCPLYYMFSICIQVLMEAMRLYSPASLYAKATMKGGMRLPVGEYFIPGETVLFVSTHSVARFKAP